MTMNAVERALKQHTLTKQVPCGLVPCPSSDNEQRSRSDDEQLCWLGVKQHTLTMKLQCSFVPWVIVQVLKAETPETRTCLWSVPMPLSWVREKTSVFKKKRKKYWREMSEMKSRLLGKNWERGGGGGWRCSWTPVVLYCAPVPVLIWTVDWTSKRQTLSKYVLQSAFVFSTRDLTVRQPCRAHWALKTKRLFQNVSFSHGQLKRSFSHTETPCERVTMSSLNWFRKLMQYVRGKSASFPTAVRSLTCTSHYILNMEPW